MPNMQRFNLWRLSPFNVDNMANTWFASRETLDALGLPLRLKSILIRTGQVSIQARIEEINDVSDGDSRSLKFSSDIMGSLSLPINRYYRVMAGSSGEVRIGPVIGILISSKKRQKIAGGGHDSVYEQLTQRGKEFGALVCFFSPTDVEWGARVVKALLLDLNNDKFKPAILPLPDVIYDRCFGDDNKQITYEFRDQLARWGAGTKIFNSIPKLGKWDTWQALSRNPATVDFMPETHLIRNGGDVISMLDKHGAVYLKPDKLYKGKGVHKLSRLSNGKLMLGYRGEERNEDMEVSDWDEVAARLMPYWDLEAGYLVQRGLDLAKYKGLSFDFRALCQKDIEGKWVTSGIAARIAAAGAVITSPRSGGTVQFIQPALADAFKGGKTTVEKCLKEIDRVAHMTCSVLEDAYGICGELGLDMAFDKDCRLWIIEVNGKPLKVSLNRLGDEEISSRIIDMPIDYSVFLSGFGAGNRAAGGEYR